VTDLLVLAREFDLPPKWDGLLVVKWTPWEAQTPAFICPPPKTRPCCPGCGSPEPSVVCRGMVALRPDLTREQWEYEEENRARLGKLAHKRKNVALWRLHAFRCQDCRLDSVCDTDTDEWWDLDHTDYGPEGST
jgi:hypothetical protein